VSLYAMAKRLARVVPKTWRRRFWQHRRPGDLMYRVKTWLERRAKHSEMYDTQYYAYVDECMAKSAAVMADTIVGHFAPASVVDVGCGSGMLLLMLKNRGIRATGLEYSEAGLAICRSRGLDVRPFDIESAHPFTERAELAISTEVAEHLPASVADRYVDLLCGISDRVLMTAARPGQGGTDHVNEQPPEYWVEKFRARGYEFDTSLTEALRADWRGRGTQSWYAENVLVFHRPR
jgi:SAM-dependent methyltransferase